jgi:hypothetical protein
MCIRKINRTSATRDENAFASLSVTQAVERAQNIPPSLSAVTVGPHSTKPRLFYAVFDSPLKRAGGRECDDRNKLPTEHGAKSAKNS